MSADLRVSGRTFQAAGPATLKAALPILFSLGGQEPAGDMVLCAAAVPGMESEQLTQIERLSIMKAVSHMRTQLVSQPMLHW